jgi:predicted nucleic acid-binding protein
MRSALADFFVDANILLYPFDREDPVRNARASEIVSRLTASGQGIISTQVLAESFSVLTRKRALRVPVVEAARFVTDLLASWTVLSVTGDVVREAVRGAVRYQLSYYDAQIWAVARLNGIATVLSEDFQHGSTIEGITFLNALDPTFDLDQLGPAPITA